MISCLIAILLPAALLYGNVFYSGHIILVGTFLVLGAWRILALIAFPFLSLEVAPGRRSIERTGSILTLVVLFVAAIALDIFIASRFEPDDALDGRAPSAVYYKASGATPE